MLLPTFIVIGAAKSATSSLCQQLASHPDVFFSRPKEPSFFGNPRQGRRTWEWYQGLFANAGPAKAIGEGSTIYSDDTRTPSANEEIAERLPHAKLIYICRHPIDRIPSLYAQMISNGRKLRPFPEEVLHGENLVRSSRYYYQINRYRRYFPDSQILLLTYEDYIADRASVLDRVFAFIGVPPVQSASRMNTHVMRREDLVMDSPILRRIRHSPIGSFVVAKYRAMGYGGKHMRWIKSKLRTQINRRLKAPLEVDTTWTEEARQFAVEQLRDDADCFLDLCGKPKDFWKF